MSLRNRIGLPYFLLAALIVMPSMALADEDPWERFNRSMYRFNDSLDKAILKPVAKTYDRNVPSIVKQGTGNFFSNLGEVSNTLNNLLQGDVVESAASGSRFLINSTIGLFGLIDVASAVGIKEYKEDFGQTLAVWGIGSGPYLVLPFFGPSTLRDGSGMYVDYLVDSYLFEELDLHWEEELALDILSVVHTRAELLAVEGMIIGDPYSFIRDVYLQTRQNDIYDGALPTSTKAATNDGGWGDESADDGWGDEPVGDGWGDEPVDDGWGDEVIDDGWGEEEIDYEEEGA